MEADCPCLCPGASSCFEDCFEVLLLVGLAAAPGFDSPHGGLQGPAKIQLVPCPREGPGGRTARLGKWTVERSSGGVERFNST